MKTKTKKRYAYVIETTKCIDCKACMVGCKAENGVQVGRSRNWVEYLGPKGVFPNLTASLSRATVCTVRILHACMSVPPGPPTNVMTALYW